MPAIIYSSKDTAGYLIAEQLRRHHGFKMTSADERRWLNEEYNVQMMEIRAPLLEAEALQIESDYLIFASKHRSATAKPTLTVHATGNWGAKAEMGGRPGEVCYPQTSAMKHALRALAEQKFPDFEVSLECTHHGPTTTLSPLFFIELGSSEEQWRNPEAAKVVADAIMLAVKREQEQKYEQVALGIGGGHYCPDFTKIELETDWAFGHIVPAYAIDEASEEVLMQAVEKSDPEIAVLDWKGLKAEQRQKAIAFAEKAGLDWKKDDEVKKEGD
ncbi:MAG: D-aminoacyl-tRNA deacylase [Candidatus Burarchaeum sp.]|nr:D-aminoacyl-tRNA deacylase [Candidatus Burarchaeum sp.]MDO8340311.1 D-aminoacyl-tRNA deacylase [Candidatus Burarchaeum sp.]